mgnify:CR=1 FL=1
MLDLYVKPEAVIYAGNARFTVLTPRLIRLEYHPAGTFEDRPSQTMWYRQQPKPDFTLTQNGDQIIIETESFRLSYHAQAAFSAENLSIYVKQTDAEWHPGDVNTGNLKGTTRTLDFINGYTPLNDGLISRDGWSLVDDSNTFIINDDEWLEARDGAGIDWYFFAYGQDYKTGLRDYCLVSGDIPMIPRWILGNWWSRYWAYTQEELMSLIEDFEAHQIPLSICIVDMDWHVTQTGNTSSGWTGYTWNKDLFPNPQALIDFFHEKGLRTSLNLHPADGIHPHEAQYPEMARRMGIDPESKQPIEFDITDPTFVKAYFEVLHHPYEAMGVDFWWLDWQQGLTCKIENLDPLWLINHLHFKDMGRDHARRPFIFSRWGNEGHQRYPIGFSGDSYMTWDMLNFQPYMTATASNVAYGWWSHDIGGHTSGVGDRELFTRWVQFGIFSPIMRIHTTKGYFYDQRPWSFGDAEVENVLRDAMQLRHAMIPYIYTMAWRGYQESLPLMLPMYYDYPDEEAAYHCPQQYLFGTELIAAPFTEAADPDTGLARQVVWLPKGDWYHAFTGEYYEGDRWHAIYGALRDIPVFAKAGAILPLGEKVGWGGIDNPNHLHIHAFAGGDNTFTLYEDDGTSRDYLDGGYCQTTITQQWSNQHLTLTIEPAIGNLSVLPAERVVTLHIHGVQSTTDIQVNGASISARYDAETETLIIEQIPFKPTDKLQVEIHVALSRRDRKAETLLKMLRAFRLHTGVRNQLAEKLPQIIAEPEKLAPYLVTMKQAHIRALCELLYEAGVHHIADTHHPTLLILWNNREDDAIRYRYGDAYLFFGMVNSTTDHRGALPRYQAIIPEIKKWTHGASDEHVHRTQWSLQVDYHTLASIRIEEA